uniref:Uncharacterized protein n=1 Tax=viral metagenome TaxID=1070528 RepID=A0A6C0C4W0_9ZZZZ
MNQFEQNVRSLCTPAQIYFFLSMSSLLAIMSQNSMHSNIYKVGSYSVPTPFNNMVTFLVKIASIVIWTYILKYLCDHGFLSMAWFLVLIPIILMFVIIGVVIIVLSENKNIVQRQVRAFQKTQRPGINQKNISQ